MPTVHLSHSGSGAERQTPTRYGTFYTTGGSAGIPVINIPIGPHTDPETGESLGEPAGVYITGPYLSDARLIAVGYALEQALGGYTPPDLDTTIAGIEAVTSP